MLRDAFDIAVLLAALLWMISNLPSDVSDAAIQTVETNPICAFFAISAYHR